MQYFAKNSNKFFVMNQYKIGRYKFYKTFYDTLHTRHPFFKGAILHNNNRQFLLEVFSSRLKL